MACLIDGPVLLEYFPTKAEMQRVEKRAMKQWGGRKPGRRGSNLKERRGSRHGNVIVRRHGRLERRAPFINASSQSQHGDMQWLDH